MTSRLGREKTITFLNSVSMVTIGMKIFDSVFRFVNKLKRRLAILGGAGGGRVRKTRAINDAHLCPESRMLVLPLVLAGTLHLATADVDFRSACDEISYGYCRYKHFCVCVFLKLIMNKVLSYLNTIPGKLWHKGIVQKTIFFRCCQNWSYP